MTTLISNIILHVLLIGSMGSFIVAIVADAIADPDRRERVLRIAGLAVGALVAVGAQVFGVSYAAFIVNSMVNGAGPSAAAAFAASAVPAIGGIGLGWFLVRTYRRSTRIGARMLGFIGMLASTAFVAIYAQATQTKGVILGAAALPNVSFVVGVILTIIFTFDPDLKRGGNRRTQIRVLLGGGGRQTSAAVASHASPTGAPPIRQRRDPFSESQ
ncbi:hypothetical protein ACIA5D_36425 [Actinoplanes sp. NPDC051513]|uniref:hypothetical protein n=1 Tax=Actinoplanes sp. NPDC051513 TaxID=3363908 RepID=UPI003799C0E3